MFKIKRLDKQTVKWSYVTIGTIFKIINCVPEQEQNFKAWLKAKRTRRETFCYHRDKFQAQAKITKQTTRTNTHIKVKKNRNVK